MYFNAEGVARSLPKAAELYNLAATKGHGKAATTLSYMYYHGDGVDRDLWKASELAKIGAAKGQSDAMFLLGCKVQYLMICLSQLLHVSILYCVYNMSYASCYNVYIIRNHV
jgi:TPR repeat protein